MRCRFVAAILVLAALAVGTADAKDPPPPKPVAAATAVKAGTSALVSAPNALRYYLRVPKGYDKRHGARLVVVVHDDDAAPLGVLRALEEQTWSAADLLAVPCGEGGDPAAPCRSSALAASAVAGVVRDIGAAYKVTRAYLGGHRAGAAPAWGALLGSPYLFRGGFVVGGKLPDEVDVAASDALASARRSLAIVLLDDGVESDTPYAGIDRAWDLLRAADHTRIHRVRPTRTLVQFHRVPVADVIGTLDSLVVESDETAAWAQKWNAAREWGLALETLRTRSANLRQLAPNSPEWAAWGRAEAGIAAAIGEIPFSAKPEGAIGFFESWLDFRRRCGGSETNSDPIRRLIARGREQADAAKKTLADARTHAAAGRKDAARERYVWVVVNAYTTPEAYEAWRALIELG